MTADKQLIKRRFAATFERYNQLALVQQDICRRLASMACAIANANDIRRAMEIGSGTGFLTERLVAEFPEAEWFFNDLAETSGKFIKPMLENVRYSCLWADAETTDFPSPLDLVASASTVQWFDDLQGFLDKCACVTRPGGILALSSFGPQNFREVKEAAGESLAYHAAEEICEMAGRAGYEIIDMQEQAEMMCFESPMEVLHHIKATGVNSIAAKAWTKGRLAEFDSRYRALFPSGGKVGLTYHPILIAARRK